MKKQKRCIKRPLQEFPESPIVHLNHGLVLLAQEPNKEAWKEWEWRFKNPARQIAGWDQARLPPWQGENIKGKRLLVFCEQALGDNLQFSRYLKLLKEEGPIMTLVCPAVLATLFKKFLGLPFCCDRVPPLEDYDFGISLLSLPALIPMKGIPSSEGTFVLGEAELKWGRKKLEEFKNFKVGINWKGSGRAVSGINRHLDLNAFKPLNTVAGLDLISLQYGAEARDLKATAGFENLPNIGERLDFCQLASVLSALDCVITIDTALAHLAGIFSKKVFLIVPYSPTWHWQPRPGPSRWYSSISSFLEQSRRRG